MLSTATCKSTTTMYLPLCLSYLVLQLHRYGCPYCLDEGVHLSHRHIYPPNDEHRPRSTPEMLRWAQKAEQQGKPVKGVKGFSVLSKCLDIVKSVPIDYMHAVLEGVTKSLTTTWFDSRHHGKKFYLKPQVKDIDKALLRIKPPSDIPRVPRSVESHLKYWKGNEYRAWLLFYSLPVLKDFLPADYLHHLALLVSAIYKLLCTDITSDQISAAEEQLNLFYTLIPILYTDQLCTMNVHSLIHLPDCVRRWGPLWAYSCFSFENMNGFLKKQCHSTKNVLPQLICSLHTRQSLPSLQKRLTESETDRTITLLKNIGSFSKHSHPTGPLGQITSRKITNEESQLIMDELDQESGSYITTFSKYRFNHTTLRATDSVKTSACRNDSIFSLDEHFCSIKTLCCIGDRHMAIVEVFEEAHDQHLPQARQRELLQNSRLIDVSFLHQVKKLSLSKTTKIVPIEKLASKCVLIPLKHSPTNCIVTLPNSLEHH